jgi:hypothetical protein
MCKCITECGECGLLYNTSASLPANRLGFTFLHCVPHIHMLMLRLQGQPSAKEHSETGSARKKRDSKAGRAACTASLALTMLLMLKRFLKATYNMSEERIAAFSPDIPEKRKQVSLHRLMSCKAMPCFFWHLAPDYEAGVQKLTTFFVLGYIRIFETLPGTCR